MKKTGELLKAKRESANLSLSEVALATKINPKVLQAIEDGESEKLPAKTFLKGFVRSYALYLKADLDEILRVFTEETGGPTPPTLHEAYQKTDGAAPARRGPPDEESSSGLRTVMVLVIALLIGAIIGVRELIEKYQKEKVIASGEVKVSPLPEGTPAADAAKVADVVSQTINGNRKSDMPLAAISTSEAEASHVVSRGSASSSPARPVKLDSDGGLAEMSKPLDIAKAAEAIKPIVTAKPMESAKPAEPAKIVEVAAAIAAAPPVPITMPSPAKGSESEKAKDTDAPDASAETAKPAPPKTARNEIILEAKDKVEVSFKIHGETKHLSMGPDDVHTIRTAGPIALEVSDGGALTIIFNGTERGAAGAAGQPAQLTLP